MREMEVADSEKGWHMIRQSVGITFYTPDWKWCEVRNPGRRTKSGDRCKFCQEVRQRGDATRYYCLVYDQDLMVKDGSVEKCCPCMLELTERIEHAMPRPSGPARKSANEVFKVVKKTLRDHKKQFMSMRKDGYPEQLAYELATEQILEGWEPEEEPVETPKRRTWQDYWGQF